MAAEKPSLMDDMQDDGYRFAHDLLTKVIKMSGKHVPYVRFPNPENFLLTDSHRKIIEEFLAQKGKYIEGLVCELAKNVSFSDFNYFENRAIVMREFKPEPYSEEGFVKLCAAIAHVAACIFLRNTNCDVTIHAMHDVHGLVKKVLARGTLQDSSWPED